MIEAIFKYGQEALTIAGPIRYEVFTIGQGVPAEIECDFYDAFAHHILVFDGKKAIATGRLIYKDYEFLIGRIAVLPDQRGNNYGDLVVRMLVDRAFSLGAKEVVVHAQLQVRGFYEKIGFMPLGVPFFEADIQHIHMVIYKDGLTKKCKE